MPTSRQDVALHEDSVAGQSFTTLLGSADGELVTNRTLFRCATNFGSCPITIVDSMSGAATT